MFETNTYICAHVQEEIVLQGPCGVSDVRIVNSYPSKVSIPFPVCVCMIALFAVLVSQQRVQVTPQSTIIDPIIDLMPDSFSMLVFSTALLRKGF